MSSTIRILVMRSMARSVDGSFAHLTCGCSFASWRLLEIVAVCRDGVVVAGDFGNLGLWAMM